MSQNRFGVPRPIPPDVKRQVRQRCGYGCVICAKAPYDYDHFDPEFADAQSHDPKGITLLCAEHHDLKSRGLLTNAQVASRNAAPRAVAEGHAFGRYITDGTAPKFVLGSCYAANTPVLLMADGEPVIWASPPVEPGAPFSFNAVLRDQSGRTILEIRDNEWRAGIEAWDVDVVANRIEIRSKRGAIDLVISMEPPDTLNVQRARLNYGGRDVVVETNGDVVMGGLRLSYVSVDNCGSLISISTGLPPILSEEERELRRRYLLRQARSSTSLSPLPG